MKKKTNKTENISEKGTESTLKSYKSDLEEEFNEGRKLVIYGLTISEMTDLALEMHRRGLKTIMK